MIVQNNLLRARMEKKTAAFDPAVVSAGKVLHALILLLAALVICLLVQNPLLELLAAVTATVGSLTGFIHSDPVGCADVRFKKKQADLVYRAMRRKRDVLVLSLSWDGAVDCLQSNSLYPDPVGCADVRFKKKQADLVYRAMRRKGMFWFYLSVLGR